MVDNVVADAGAGGATLAMREITHGGDTAQLAGAWLAGISGAEGSYTWGAIGGTAANGLEVDVTRLSALVTSTAEIGNVKNSGTFATQATLQAGTAEIGKLAAGSAVIGEVTIGAATGAAGDLAKAEDAAHSSGDIGVMSLAVRNDVLAALAGTDGDYAPLQVNASGALYIQEGAALDVSAATLTVNAHAVTNAGTFAVQSTLQAGTAEFGKLAAGVAEIGNVKNSGTFATQATLQAGTAEIGKLAAGTAAIGKLAANSGVDIGDVDVLSIAAGSNLLGDVGIGVRTSGGIPIDSVYYDMDLDETAVAAKAAAGQVYFIHAMNTTAAPLYLQFFNVAQGSVTVGTTTPDMQFIIPGNADSDGAGFTINFNAPIDFDVAVTVACSTDNEGNSAPGANACHVNIGIN